MIPHKEGNRFPTLPELGNLSRLYCWPILALCWPILAICWPILAICWPLGPMSAERKILKF